MSSLNFDDVLRLAKLANITISNEEVGTFKTQLSDVIAYFEKLKKLDTESVEPTSQFTGLEDVLREDKINPLRVLSQESATSGTDKTYNGYFVVDQLIDKDSADNA